MAGKREMGVGFYRNVEKWKGQRPTSQTTAFPLSSLFVLSFVDFASLSLSLFFLFLPFEPPLSLAHIHKSTHGNIRIFGQFLLLHSKPGFLLL